MPDAELLQLLAQLDKVVDLAAMAENDEQAAVRRQAVLLAPAMNLGADEVERRLSALLARQLWNGRTISRTLALTLLSGNGLGLTNDWERGTTFGC